LSDYRDYSSGGGSNPTGKHDAFIQKRWWLSDRQKDLARSITGVVSQLVEYDAKRQTQYQISSRLYANTTIMGSNGLSYSKIASTASAQRDRVSFNVVQSVIDTITAKIAKNKPKPLFLTSGGNWVLRTKAKKLDKYMDGVFYQNKAHSLGVDIFRDAAIWGDGIIQVYPHAGTVCYDRVMVQELVVDWVEAFYGKPTQLHRVKNVDREVLAEMFPGKRAVINRAKPAIQELIGYVQNVSDQVTVIESWHLPSGPDATDGLHVITLDEDTLFVEQWEEDFFPFAKLPWTKRQNGYWGQGLAEQLQNIQFEINKILWVIQRSFHLAGTFKVFLENGSKIVKEHLNNDIGAIVNYTGTPPQYAVPPIVPMEIYQHLEKLKQSAYELAGVSMLSAASQKPAGLNSGKALREYNDIESDRFMVVGQQYEGLFMDLAALTVWCAKGIYQDGKGDHMPVKVPGKRFVETIEWKDVDLKDDEYVLKMFPVSSLPQEPAGRLQTVTEYAQAGFISPRTAQRLLDFPDLEQVDDLQTAEEEYLTMALEKMVEKGIVYHFEPAYDDPQLARQLALEFYAQGKRDGMPEDKLELLRQFIGEIDDAAAKVQAAQQAQAMQMQAMQGQTQNASSVNPTAQPQPVPQSDLVPNGALAS